MIDLLLATLPIFAMLLIVELIWRSGRLHAEYSRKVIHILTGSYVAFWPYFIERKQILLLVAALFLTILLSRSLQLFRSIHQVKRTTFGDLLFPLALAVAALVAESDIIFTAVVLHMSLADGLAAVIGTRWGKGNAYSVFGGIKSVVGTLTFIVVSGGIVLTVLAGSNQPLLPAVVLIPLGAAVLENIGAYGLDNVFVTGFVLIVLNAML